MINNHTVTIDGELVDLVMVDECRYEVRSKGKVAGHIIVTCLPNFWKRRKVGHQQPFWAPKWKR